jgi:hypothetical protein
MVLVDAKLQANYKVRNNKVADEIAISNSNQNHTLQPCMLNITNTLKYAEGKCLQLSSSSNMSCEVSGKLRKA